MDAPRRRECVRAAFVFGLWGVTMTREIWVIERNKGGNGTWEVMRVSWENGERNETFARDTLDDLEHINRTFVKHYGGASDQYRVVRYVPEKGQTT